ncbi:unnamed protein product [Allacma fusca]|uniref:Uncharacterized protein n=1 Tax=Allacma fusca TaxID=39272 RepID=A0A8J2LGX1_9HEXA|nr:unnamed protein product [Allacma fusca]
MNFLPGLQLLIITYGLLLCQCSQDFEQIDLQPLMGKLDNCIIRLMPLMEPFDYSGTTTPFILQNVPYQRYHEDKFVMYHFFKLVRNDHVFKERNLRCNILLILHKNENRIFRKYEEHFKEQFEGSWKNSLPLRMVLLLSQTPTEPLLLNKFVAQIQARKTFTPIFVLLARRTDGAHKYLSGYFACWFFWLCKIPLDCSTEDCLTTLDNVFNQITDSGRKTAWELWNPQKYKRYWSEQGHLISEYPQVIFSMPGTKPWNPLQESHPWGLYETIYSYLVSDLDLNVSLFIQKLNGQIYPATKARASVEIEIGYTDKEITSGLLQNPKHDCIYFRNKTRIEVALREPKTALVIFSYELEYYWNVIRRVTFRAKEKIRFAHNRKVKNDLFLSQPISLYVETDIPEKYNFALKRAQSMLSSGLFGLWEKWDKIRFTKCMEGGKGRYTDRDEETIKAFSMDDSIVLALYAFLWSNSICVLVFLLEVLQVEAKILLEACWSGNPILT